VVLYGNFYMNLQTLGQSDIKLTSIGLGTNYVGGHNLYENVDEKEGVRLVQRAIDEGITHLDTADAYGFGRSEELVGEAIAGRRNEVVLASKGGILFGEHGTGADSSPAYLRAALERSLKRLNVEYIDLYYIHRHDGTTPVEEAFGALMDFKSEGLIRAAGVSNFDLPSLKAAASVGSVDALQSRYNLLQREAEAEVLPWCAQNDVSFIPWGGLAYGLLGGKYNRDFVLDEKDWRHRTGAFAPGAFEKNLDAVDGLKKIADELGSKPAHLAINWLIAQPGVGSVIAGAKNVDQVTENIASSNINIGDDVLTAISALTTSGV